MSKPHEAPRLRWSYTQYRIRRRGPGDEGKRRVLRVIDEGQALPEARRRRSVLGSQVSVSKVSPPVRSGEDPLSPRSLLGSLWLGVARPSSVEELSERTRVQPIRRPELAPLAEPSPDPNDLVRRLARAQRPFEYLPAMPGVLMVREIFNLCLYLIKSGIFYVIVGSRYWQGRKAIHRLIDPLNLVRFDGHFQELTRGKKSLVAVLDHYGEQADQDAALSKQIAESYEVVAFRYYPPGTQFLEAYLLNQAQLWRLREDLFRVQGELLRYIKGRSSELRLEGDNLAGYLQERLQTLERRLGGARFSQEGLQEGLLVSTRALIQGLEEAEGHYRVYRYGEAFQVFPRMIHHLEQTSTTLQERYAPSEGYSPWRISFFSFSRNLQGRQAELLRGLESYFETEQDQLVRASAMRAVDSMQAGVQTLLGQMEEASSDRDMFMRTVAERYETMAGIYLKYNDQSKAAHYFYLAAGLYLGSLEDMIAQGDGRYAEQMKKDSAKARAMIEQTMAAGVDEDRAAEMDRLSIRLDNLSGSIESLEAGSSTDRESDEQ